MKNSRTTAGATLVLTVLIVLMMLASIVVVTGQISLSARRSSNDQDATIQAQYAAESGVARAQAQLNVVNNLMTKSLKPAAAITTSQMLTQMANLCGVGTPTAAMSNLTGVNFSAPLTLCSSSNLLSTFTTSTLAVAGVMNLNLFTSNIDNSAYATYGYPLTGDSATAERTFWAQSLLPAGVTLDGTVNGKTISGSAGLTLTKVQRFGLDSYRLTFAVPDVVATGSTSGVSRKLAVSGVSNEYTYEISRGSFAKYALFTDHHFANQAAEDTCAANASNCNRVTFTSNTLFSGPVHSNQSFLMQGTPFFAGQVTSAGCPPGGISTTNGVESCGATAKPGGYFQSNTLTSPGAMQPNSNAPVACSSTVVPCPAANIINPQFTGGIDWGAAFQPLPQNANNQANASAGLNPDGTPKGDAGLLLSGNVDSIDLSVGNITPTGGSSTPAQFITYKMSGSAISVQLAVDANKTVYIKTGGNWRPAVQVGGVWIDASLPAAVGVSALPFNGVIYTNGSVTAIKGPARTDPNDPTTAGSAVASFSQMTLAAAGDIHIKGDLKYQNPPCSGSNSVSGTTFTAAPCPNTTAQNILGLYSSGGDIDIDSPSKYNASNSSYGVGRDVTIQAVLMASQGRVTVDGYDAGSATDNLGQVKLLGGIIEKYYGPFGITDGHGFGRNFVYDPRTGDGLAPPSFPTQQSWETDFKKTTSPGGANVKLPLKLDGSYRQTN